MITWKCFGRKWPWPNRDALLSFDWKDWGYGWETSHIVAGIRPRFEASVLKLSMCLPKGLTAWDIILSRTMCDYRRGFGLDIGIIDYFTTRLGTTSNYSSIAEHHNSQITTTPTKSFPVRYVFTSHSLATASNSGNSSASRDQVVSERRIPTGTFPHRLPYRTDLSPLELLGTARADNTVHCRMLAVP
jgi:hypothetical protein